MCLSHHGICMLFLFQSQTRKTVRQGRPPVVSTVPPQVLTLMVRCRVCSCVCALALFCVCVCCCWSRYFRVVVTALARYCVLLGQVESWKLTAATDCSNRLLKPTAQTD